jgi:hypothetical protein
MIDDNIVKPFYRNIEMKTKKLTQPEEFTTSDLYLAAFIAAQGQPLLRIERRNSRVYFVFPEVQRTHELQSQFFNNGIVNVGDYRRSLQDLKTLIFSAK